VATSYKKTLKAAVVALEAWYDEQRPLPDEEPERYVIAAAIAVLEHFPKHFPLVREDYVTEGSQVRTSGRLISKVLARNGEPRTFSREGGRTTRGTRPAAESFASRMNALPGAEDLTGDERLAIAGELQLWLTRRATAYLDKRRLEVEIVLTKPASDIIGDILAVAATKGLAGPVAQYLVGAKLALRFPGQEIENHSYTTADEQLKRQGDFCVGNTAIHVTVAPMQQLFERCQRNLQSGYRTLLLVPVKKVEAARELADIANLTGRLGVLSIEDFVGQNMEEMSGFSRDGLRVQMRELLLTYNVRVKAKEVNPGIQIDIPEL
jgi:hypothetical protein